MVRRLTFVNEKGGTGKTTLAVNFSAYLSLHHGRRVLLIDMDPQGQAGKCLGMDVLKFEPSVLDLLIYDHVPLEACVQNSSIPNVDIVASNKFLTDFSVNVAEESDRYLKLFKKTRDLAGYDYLVVDSPPSLGLLTLNILLAVTEVYIPVALTYLAMDGCAEIISTIEKIRDNFGKNDLEIRRIIPTMYRKTKLADEILEHLKRTFGSGVTDTVLRLNVKIDEAQSHGKSIFQYSPHSRGATMLSDIFEEVIDIGR